MSVKLSAVQVQCDWCGVVGAERPLAPSGIIVESELPKGWTAIGYGSVRGHPNADVEMKNVYGSMITHLCLSCSGRPAGDLLEFLGAMSHDPAASAV